MAVAAFAILNQLSSILAAKSGVGGYRALINLLARQVHYLSAPTPIGNPNIEFRDPKPTQAELLSLFHSGLDIRHSELKLAGRLGAAPSELSFGDSAAQAGARPI